MHLLPVLVQRLLLLRARVHQVLDELAKGNVVAFLQCIRLWVEPVAADDLGAVALVEGGVVAEGELVPVGRHQALKGLPHEDEFEVAAKAMVDLGH